jgi:hypothetical protein
MSKQCTDTILMIRPKNFGFNPETAPNNSFQSADTSLTAQEIQQRALAEFDSFVTRLQEHTVRVVVVEDTESPRKPDAIFPNNWISFHQSSALITYPMQSKIRRNERREDIIEQVMAEFAFERRYSLEHYEEKGHFLEGTGSMVLDRSQKVVYACISIRTDPTTLDKFCALTGYSRVLFQAKDHLGASIYHTNVLMSIGDQFAVICLECIDLQDRKKVETSLKDAGKTIIEISLDQLRAFAGNMLEVKGASGQSFIVMSRAGWRSLRKDQQTMLEDFGQIISVPLETIEHFGGGSARCMMAEIFTPTPNGDY